MFKKSYKPKKTIKTFAEHFSLFAERYKVHAM